MTPAERLLRAATAAVCGYECLALCSRRVPSVTALVARYRLAGAPIVAGLIIHFYLPKSRTTAAPVVVSIIPERN